MTRAEAWRARRHPTDSAASQRNATMRAQARATGCAWLSINRYGAVCLNSLRVFFGDIDCHPDPGSRRPRQALDTFEQAHARVDQVAAAQRLAFRVYRTHAGIRLIEITRLHQPAAEPTLNILRQLQCDIAFIRLTKKGENFRARLTPKPWRAKPRIVNFHWKDNDVTKYTEAAPWKVATYLRTAGAAPEKLHPEIARIIELHDRYCQASAEDDRPLA